MVSELTSLASTNNTTTTNRATNILWNLSSKHHTAQVTDWSFGGHFFFKSATKLTSYFPILSTTFSVMITFWRSGYYAVLLTVLNKSIYSTLQNSRSNFSRHNKLEKIEQRSHFNILRSRKLVQKFCLLISVLQTSQKVVPQPFSRTYSRKLVKNWSQN